MKKRFSLSLFCAIASPLWAHGGLSIEMIVILGIIFLLLGAFGIGVLILILKQIQNAPSGDSVPKIVLIVYLLLLLFGVMTCGS